MLNISNKIITVDKRKEEGTTLKIENLRDRWSQAAIKRIYGYVSAIIQPFPLSEQKEIEEENNASINKIVDPGFKTVFKKISGDNSITIADELNIILLW